MVPVRIDKPNDPRFKLLGVLLGSTRQDAVGRMIDVYAWCTEQNSQKISKKLLDAIGERAGFSDMLIEADLAECENEVCRIKGTEGRIEWLQQLTQQKQKAGEARAKNAKRDEKGHFIPENRPAGPAAIQRAPSENPAESSALTLTLPLSITNIKKNIRLKAPDPKNGSPAPPGIGRFIGAYASAYKQRYGARPHSLTDKAVQGQIKNFLKNRNIDYAVNLIEVYLQMDDPWFKTKCHDFATFTSNINKVGLALEGGRDPTATKSALEHLDGLEGSDDEGAICRSD